MMHSEVTKPFLFEGNRRKRQAEEGIALLKSAVGTLITIPNQRLLAIAAESTSLLETFIPTFLRRQAE